jgi:hypothetical protein
VVVLIVGVVRNLPDSPIRRSLLTVAGPVGASLYLNQEWALFAPTVPTRIETIEVQVFMADGSVRTWTPQLGSPVTGAIAWSRWKRLMANAVTNKPGVREGVSDWAVRRVTEPSEHPVRVSMVFKAQTLPPPGQTGTGAVASKVIYEKQLAGRP